VAEKRTFWVLSVRTVDGRDLASDEPGGEHERGNDPGPVRRRRGPRDQNVQPDQAQGREGTGAASTAKARNAKKITAASSATRWLGIASTCVMVPVRTENWLRFSARLDDGAPQVRFERIV
jgi:hypothetical protein